MAFERQEQQIGKSEENSKILWNRNLKKESIENTCITKHIYTGICVRENALSILRLCLYNGNLIQSCSLKGFLKCRRKTVLNLSNSFLTMCQSRTLILFEGHQLIRHIGFNGASEGGTEHSSLFGLYILIYLWICFIASDVM